MRSLILFIIITQSLTGCSSITRYINGETKPQAENYASLSAFLRDNQIQIDLDKTFFFARNEGIEKLYSFKPYNEDKVTNPDIYLFDSNLFLIDDEVLGGCIYDRPSSKDKDFYTAIFEVNADKIHTSSLKDLKGVLINHKGEPYFPFEDMSDEKIIFIVWSKYKGKKFIKSQVDYTLKTLKNTSEKLQLYFLNVDNYQY